MRAAAYLRVSSADQRDRQTIESQRRDVPAWIASQGWTLVAIYEDDGKSAAAGKLDARAGYHRLVADARAGRFDVVVVAAPDRLTRSEDPVERAQVVAAITGAGCQLAVVGAGVQDPATFAGDAYLTLQLLFAAEENRRRRSRVIAGHITAAHRGRKPRGSTPYGLTYAVESGAWGIDPTLAEVIREIAERTAAGEPSQRIARDLTRRGLERPRGGKWTSSRVRSIIHSDVYLGRYVVDAARGLSVAVPPLLDADLATAARDVLVSRYRRPAPRQVAYHLLAGLATCGLCGAGIGIAGTTDRGTGSQPTVYRCLHRREPPAGSSRCTLPLLRTAGTDERVWWQIVDALADPQVVDRALAMADRADAAPDPEVHRAELARLDRVQSGTLAQLADGLIGQATADATIARLAARRTATRAALSAAEAAVRGIRQATGRDAIAEALDALRRAASTAPPEERREIVRLATARAVVSGDVIALDLAIDTATIVSPGAAPSGWTDLPVRRSIGALRILPDRRSRVA